MKSDPLPKALARELEALREQAGDEGECAAALVLADQLLERGHRRGAASALDRAHALRPEDAQIAAQRSAVLDELAVDELGLRWRYVPAGSFLQGSEQGDSDERPVHRVRTGDYWLSETTLSWAGYCELLDWTSPPRTGPRGDEKLSQEERWSFRLGDKVRHWYCGPARHADVPFRDPAVSRGEASWDDKPMVAVTHGLALQAVAGANRRASAGVRFALPGESAWEKAARGGRVGKRYAWGDEPATPARCECERFGTFALRPLRSLPANGYGLYAMCGGVWEWTADRYDALAYHLAAGGDCPATAPKKPPAPEHPWVLRGGSWGDAAAACTVSFRMARLADSRDYNANTGLRLMRTVGA